MGELVQYWGCNVPAICDSYNVYFGEIIVLGMAKLCLANHARNGKPA
jgi:hypothetical protein